MTLLVYFKYDFLCVGWLCVWKLYVWPLFVGTLGMNLCLDFISDFVWGLYVRLYLGDFMDDFVWGLYGGWLYGWLYGCDFIVFTVCGDNLFVWFSFDLGLSLSVSQTSKGK